jgi:hypothetical protein
MKNKLFRTAVIDRTQDKQRSTKHEKAQLAQLETSLSKFTLIQGPIAL